MIISLKVISLNIRGYFKNTDELIYLIKLHNPDIICLQETLLGDFDKINIIGYSFYQKTRKKNGGGVAILFRREINCDPIAFGKFGQQDIVEMCGISIKTFNDNQLQIISCYIPPTTTVEELSSLNTLTFGNTIICGDFNAHYETWSQGKQNSRGKYINEWILDNNLFLCNNRKEITYTKINKRSSTPDLVVVSNNLSSCVEKITVGDFCGSDHFPLILILNLNKECLIKQIIKKVYVLKTLNINSYKNELRRTMDILEETDKNWKTNIKNWDIGILSAWNKCCKQKEITVNKRGNVWYNESIDVEIKKRNKLWKKLTVFPSTSNMEKFKKQKRIVKKMVRKFKHMFWTDLNKNKKIDDIFKTERNKKINENNYTISDGNRTISKLIFMNKFCATLANKNVDNGNKITLEKIGTMNKKDKQRINRLIEENEVGKIVNSLNKRKSPGSDKITNIMIKKGGDVMNLYLTKFFNRIWIGGDYPDKWNKALVIPVPKVLKRNIDITEFRPISLLQTTSKIMERVVMERLKKAVNNVMDSSKQYGFKKYRSTLNNLNILQSHFHLARTSKKVCCAVFLDIKSAYDTVDRKILINMLHIMLGECNLYRYLKKFLSKRVFKLKFHDEESIIHEQLRGLPQGSVLSPTLFNFYIKEITDLDYVYGYADDILIVVTDDPNRAADKVQKTINNIFNITKKLGLSLSIKKCKYMISSKIKNLSFPNIHIDTAPLERVTKILYLGVLFEVNNSFKSHINLIANRAKKRIGYFKYLTNKITGCKTDTLINIYKSYIRPKLEYGVTVWGGAAKFYLKRLESIQHSFLCFALGVTFRTARIDVNNLTNVETLEIRRLYLMMVYYRKEISNNLETIIPEISNEKSDYNRKCTYQFFLDMMLKFGMNITTLLNTDVKEIKNRIRLKVENEMKESDRRNCNEAFLKKMIIEENKKRKNFKMSDERISRKKECIFNQTVLGTLQLKKFTAKLNRNNDMLCPNKFCKGIENRTHFLFYCQKYSSLRKTLFNSQRVKNKKRQIEILSDKRMKVNIIEYVTRAWKIRGKEE